MMFLLTQQFNSRLTSFFPHRFVDQLDGLTPSLLALAVRTRPDDDVRALVTVDGLFGTDADVEYLRGKMNVRVKLTRLWRWMYCVTRQCDILDISR